MNGDSEEKRWSTVVLLDKLRRWLCGRAGNGSGALSDGCRVISRGGESELREGKDREGG